MSICNIHKGCHYKQMCIKTRQTPYLTSHTEQNRGQTSPLKCVAAAAVGLTPGYWAKPGTKAFIYRLIVLAPGAAPISQMGFSRD